MTTASPDSPKRGNDHLIMLKIMVNEREAAAMLGYGLTKFRELGVPCIKHGRSKRYRVDALRTWAANAEKRMDKAPGRDGAAGARKQRAAPPSGRQGITEILAMRQAAR